MIANRPARPADVVGEAGAGNPAGASRPHPKEEEAAKELKKRTLTKLYNERPAWLDNLHRQLDEAVAARLRLAGGSVDHEILERLFELNQERAGVAAAALAPAALA